jgi:hypothetical protein
VVYDTTRSAIEEQQLFLTLPHYAVGLGLSKVQNWCWAYPQDIVTGWGINYMWDLVGRDSLSVYRNTGLFFRQFDLKYESPEVFFLVADNHRMGGQGETVREAQLNGIRFLLDLQCNFGTIDEYHLDSLPGNCRVIIYPLPFCPDDLTFNRLVNFVKGGGVLYVSGDISYDPERNRTRTDRLSKLLGVEFVGENYPNIRFEAHKARIQPLGTLPSLEAYDGYPCIRVRTLGAQVMARTTDQNIVATTNRLGRGRIFFSTDVLELHAPARTTNLGRMVYGSFLDWAGVKRPILDPPSPWIHLFYSRTRQDDELITVINRDDSTPLQQVHFTTRAGAARLDVARKMAGAIAITAKGDVQSIETSGIAEVRSEAYCQTKTHMMLFSLDHRDIRDSEVLCLLPMGEGNIRIRNRSFISSGQFQVGEFREGKWTSLEEGQLSVESGWLEFDVTRDRNLSIILMSSPGNIARAREQLTKLLDFEP